MPLYAEDFNISDNKNFTNDSIEEKPYTDENEINCWHYSHAKGTVEDKN